MICCSSIKWIVCLSAKSYEITGDEGEYLNSRSYYPAHVAGLSGITGIDAGGYQEGDPGRGHPSLLQLLRDNFT